MKERMVIIVVCSWLLIGLIGLGTAYTKTANVDENIVKRDLDTILSNKYNRNEILDALPTIFNYQPAAAALVLTNKNKQLLGSMYEAKRLTSASYRSLIDEIRTNNFDFSKLSEKQFMKDFSVLRYVNSDQSIVIYLINLKHIQFTDLWSFFTKNGSGVFWIFLAYMLGGVSAR